MSRGNIIELTQLENGDFEINFNNEDMSTIIIHDPLNSKFSARNLLAAAALFCTSGSMLYELNVRKSDARYRKLKARVISKYDRNEKDRAIIESMKVEVEVDVPEEHRSQFIEVLEEHDENECFITRSLNNGIKVDIEIKKT
ncbi:MAG: OsmC family protein [Candidatus Bathyarchaeota archaeon]|nr:OsmC family protein [Candidatus Bathyarchaeota archaeon]